MNSCGIRPWTVLARQNRNTVPRRCTCGEKQNPNALCHENCRELSPTRRQMMSSLPFLTMSVMVEQVRNSHLEALASPLQSSPGKLAVSNLPNYTVNAKVRKVSASSEYNTIAKALEASKSGDIIELDSAMEYRERIVIEKAVFIQSTGNGNASIIWETNQPYESTIEILCDGVVISGISIRHRSPSIASNYAVKFVDCNAVLMDCDVSSSTGSAIGIEGGTPGVLRCKLQSCKRNGAIVVPNIEGYGGDAHIKDCTIIENGLHGVLVSGGASPIVKGNYIANNTGFGLALQGAGGTYMANNGLPSNRLGAIAINLLDEGISENELADANGIAVADVLHRKL